MLGKIYAQAAPSHVPDKASARLEYHNCSHCRANMNINVPPGSGLVRAERCIGAHLCIVYARSWLPNGGAAKRIIGEINGK